MYAFVPAVFENKQDVVSESVSVLLQNSPHIIQHLKTQENFTFEPYSERHIFVFLFRLPDFIVQPEQRNFVYVCNPVATFSNLKHAHFS